MLDTVQAGSNVFDLIKSPIDRGMFVLHYFWGLTYEEIAYCFNIDPGTVRKKILKAKYEVVAAIENQ